jgi:hypothetical protein
MRSEFTDGPEMIFDLTQQDHCEFLFGQYGGQVHANAIKQKTPVTVTVESVDEKTNTIYLRSA